MYVEKQHLQSKVRWKTLKVIPGESAEVKDELWNEGLSENVKM